MAGVRMARRPAQPDPTSGPRYRPGHNVILLGRSATGVLLGESGRTLCPSRPLHTLGCYLWVGQYAMPLSLTAGYPGSGFSTCHCHLVPLPVCPLSSRAPAYNSAHPGMCTEGRPLKTIPTTGMVLAGLCVAAAWCIRTGRYPSAASNRRGYLPSACLPS